MGVLFDRVIEGANDVLAFGIRRNAGQILRQGLASHRHTGAIQHARFQHHLHQGLNTTYLDQFRHQVFAAGFEVRQHRHVLAQTGEVIQFQLDADGMGHGQQVQHGVGGATKGDCHLDRVLKGRPGHDVRGLNVVFQQVHDCLASAQAVVHLLLGNGILRRAVGQAHTHGLNGGGHGVGGIHAATGAGTRYSGVFDLFQLDVGDISGGVAAHGFKDRDDIGVIWAGLDGAAVDEDRRAIEPGHAH